MEEKAPSTSLPPEVACTNRKWNIRSVAYQTLIAQFRKLHPLSEQWDLYKNVMCKIALESSPSIREQALEVVLSFVMRCGTAMETSKDVMNSLLDKLLVSPSSRTTELLVQIILQYVEIGCSEGVIDQLLKTTLDIQTPNIAGPCINIITNILSEFGPKPIDVEYILDTLSDLRETDDVETRIAVKAFVLEFYLWRGPKSIANVEQILKRAEIKAVLQEYEDKKPTKQLKPRRIVKQKLTVNKYKKRDNNAPITLDLLSKLDDTFFKKLDSHDWKERRDALLQVHRILEDSPKLMPGNYDPVLASLKRIITEDQCVIVVGFAITCITEIANGLQQNFSPYAVGMCRILLEKFVEKRQHITEQLREALDVITVATTFESLIRTINTFLDNRNPTIIFETIQLLAKMFRKSNKQTLKKPDFSVLYKSLATCLKHGQLIIREKSLIALGVALEIAGEDVVAPYLVNVDPIIKKRIKNYKNEPGSFGEKYNEVRYRNVAKKESLKVVEKLMTVLHKDYASNKKTNDPNLKHVKNSDKKSDIKLSSNQKAENTKHQVDTNKKGKRDTENLCIDKNSIAVKKLISSSESSIEKDKINTDLETCLSDDPDSKEVQNNTIESQSEHVIVDKQKRHRTISRFKKKKDSNDNRRMLDIFKRKRSSTNKSMEPTDDAVLTTENTQSAHRSKKSTNLTSLRSEYTETENIQEIPLHADRLNKDNNDECKKLVDRASSDTKVNLANDYNMKPLQEMYSGQQHVNKIPEGFIMLNESEVKKLLGLKKSPAVSDDSTNIIQDRPSRKKMFKRKIYHIAQGLSETGTQTNSVINDVEAVYSLSAPISLDPEWIELPKVVDVIPTQTSDVNLKEKGTDPCNVIRFNRGTQWVKLADANTEMHTQTLTVRTAEVASGPVSGSWRTVAWTSKELSNNWEDVSGQKLSQSRHNEDSSPINLKSILLKKIEYREPSKKEYRRRKASVGTDPQTRTVHGRKETVEINTITVTRSNPFGERLGKNYSKSQLVSLKPRKSENKSQRYENRSYKDTQDDIADSKTPDAKYSASKQSDSFNKTKTGKGKKTKGLQSPSLNIMPNVNEKKANKGKSTREVTLQTSPYSSKEGINGGHSRNSGKLENIHLKNNERIIRLRKVELSKHQLRSKSMPSKNNFDKPLMKRLKFEKSQVSLIKISRSIQKHSQNKPPIAKKSSRIKNNWLKVSSSGSFKDGCNLFPMLQKDIDPGNEWAGKRTSKNSSRQRVFKPQRYKRHKETHYFNHVKQISSQPNEGIKHASKKCYFAGDRPHKHGPTKRYSPTLGNVEERQSVDPRTKELILSELLKVCDVSQTTFEKMVRQKSSRPCLFTPKAILQRVNELSNQPDQSASLLASEARCENYNKELKTCTIM